MAAIKKYRLLWIRALMLLSQGMLLAIAVSWLFAQHTEERTKLTKDLNTALKDAQGKVSDSLVSTLLSKIMAEKGNFNFNSRGRSAGPNFPGSSISMTFSSDEDDSTEVRKFIHKVTTIPDVSDTPVVKMEIFDSTRQSFVYRPKTNDAEKAIMPVITLMLKNIFSSGEVGEELNITPDTTTLKRQFDNEMKKHNWNFSVSWNDPGINNGNIVLNNIFLNHPYTVSIGGYSFYLLKNILPQILFIIFLLSITASAFLFTYNTLREQIRLGTIKNEFISNMSHELKTPVSTVKVALEAINNFHPITDNQTTRDYLQMATLETERLEMLINQSLNISLIEQGRIIPEKEKHDLKQLVDKTIHAMQVRFKQSNASVQVNTEATNTIANIDPLHIQGILINLLDNSLKYNNTSPVINIRLSEDEDNLFLSVADNGPGIPAEYMDKVFDKFFRVPSGDLHNVKGYGLGLSYVKQIIEQHNGNITVKNLDKGCVFTITLPKA